MILQQLYTDASAILGEAIPPPLYDLKPVRWVIVLKPDGAFVNIESLGGSKDDKKGVPRLVPYVVRTSGIRPILLCDTPAYVLGVAPDDRRAPEKHAAFRDMVLACAEETHEPSVEAVSRFLAAWKPDQPGVGIETVPSDLMTFRVVYPDGSRWPVESSSVQSFWLRSARTTGTKQVVGQCLVSGREGPLVDVLPGMVKRVPGGQTSGTALVSVNCGAFESHGLSGGYTSPVSLDAAERFTKALNRLLEDRRMHLNVGGLAYVFWTRQGADPDFFGFVDRPDPTSVRELLNAFRSGRGHYTNIDHEAFYAFALSASGARVVIRDWLQTTVREARENLARWFETQDIVEGDGSPGKPLGIYQLASALYRDARKEMAAQVPLSLVRAALHGDTLPLSLLALAIARNRAEQRVTHNRAALIKAVLVTNAPEDTRKETAERMASLDPTNVQPAYVCGRLLAELEAVQLAAQGKTNTTIVSKFYGAASTAPATVFGQLLTMAQKAHLSKLRKSKPGLAYVFQQRIEEILLPLHPHDAFPRTLPLADQALFSLGFYHQRAFIRKAIEDARQAKQQGRATDADLALADTEAATELTDTADQEEN